MSDSGRLPPNKSGRLSYQLEEVLRFSSFVRDLISFSYDNRCWRSTTLRECFFGRVCSVEKRKTSMTSNIPNNINNNRERRELLYKNLVMSRLNRNYISLNRNILYIQFCRINYFICTCMYMNVSHGLRSWQISEFVDFPTVLIFPR